MAFYINTNIASLQAQNYLQQTQSFQNQTIQEVTSGLRIVNSGDDAAGLAIANGYRSNEAVLTQGIANANDGLAQLQIADGGLSNISQLLDQARTLATESASGAFTGDRGVLNNEFQSVLTEINRQAQAIGLNQGGSFAQNLSVFIGGGQASGNVTATQNGSVNLNLSQSTVDTQSLGLSGVQAAGNANTDIGTGSNTSVQNILNNSTNQASISNNTTDFYFTGPGFSNTYGNNVVKVAVNLDGVTDANTLVTAINQGIQNAGNGASQQDTAFANAGITASVVTNASGQQQLAFSSSSTAFQVQGGDQVATALLGSFSSGSTGNVANVTATAASNFTAPAAAENGVQIRLTGMGLNGSPADDLSVNIATTDTTATMVGKINAAIAANSAVAATGVQAVADGSKIQFVGHAGQSFQVATAGDINNALGFGSYLSSSGVVGGTGTFNYNTITAVGAGTSTDTQNLQVSINGGATVNLGPFTGSGSEVTDIGNLNAAFQANAETRAAGLVASDNGSGDITISSSGADFRLNFYGGTGDAFGFGASNAGAVASTSSTASSYAAKDSIDSAGAQQSVNGTNSDVYQFTGLTNTGDAQTLTLTAVDAEGNQHTLNVNLTTANAGNLDQAVNTINQAILSSNDSTIRQIGAFKEEGTSGLVNGVEGIKFLSAGGAFKVSLGSSPNNAGLSDGVTGQTGGAVLTSAANGASATVNISNINTALAAVNALGNATTVLGNAQAVVGQGENNFNYAINLASSQLTNFQAAEAQIRDADLASESANLTKSQIQLQAGIAALAQANSAPQQILTLLSGH